jgi:hypothetical protein
MLWPDHKTTFLGKLLDAAKLWVGVPQEELQAFAQQVEELQSGTTVTPPATWQEWQASCPSSLQKQQRHCLCVPYMPL